MPLFLVRRLDAQVHEGAFIAPTATLVGDVSWKRGVGLVRRGDPRRLRAVIIRGGANVQDNAVIHGRPD